MVKFFVCREMTANENHQSCLGQDEGPLLLSEGVLFLPIVACQAIALSHSTLLMALSKVEGLVEWATADLPMDEKRSPPP